MSETAGMILKEGQAEHAWEYNQYNAGVLDVIFDRVTKNTASASNLKNFSKLGNF